MGRNLHGNLAAAGGDQWYDLRPVPVDRTARMLHLTLWVLAADARAYPDALRSDTVLRFHVAVFLGNARSVVSTRLSSVRLPYPVIW